MSKSVDNAVQVEQAKAMLKILQANVDDTERRGGLGSYRPKLVQLVERMKELNKLHKVEILAEPNLDEIKDKAKRKEVEENYNNWLKLREEFQKGNREEHAQLQKQFNIINNNKKVAWAPIYQMFEDTWGLIPVANKKGKLKLYVVQRDENGKLIKHWEK